MSGGGAADGNGNIVLIGPPGAGKSTVGPLLAAALERPLLDLDERRWGYYAELGYDPDHAQRLVDAQGLEALVAYWKPFELHSVERALAEHRGQVVAFGAGHSYYEEPAQLRRAQLALAACAHVILLLPSPDLAISARVLATRFPPEDPYAPEMHRFQAAMLAHPANRTLATATIYTLGKSPEETCAEIVRLVAPRP